MPTPNEIQHRKRDEMRVKAENIKSLAAKKDVLRKRLTELSQQKIDLNRQISETSRELSRLA